MSFLAFGLAALLSGGNLHALKVTNGSRPFAGDNRLLTTVSPNGDGFRDKAIVSFRLDRRREGAARRPAHGHAAPGPRDQD